MAKLQQTLGCPFSVALQQIETGIMRGSVSASLEESTDMHSAHARCSVRVFERYSAMGSNRVSLSVTLFQEDGEAVQLCAVAAGGSQAMFFKLNTFGEEAFLDKLRDILQQLPRS